MISIYSVPLMIVLLIITKVYNISVCVHVNRANGGQNMVDTIAWVA